MMNRLFAGSGTLTRFIFKRDLVNLLIWIISLAGFVIALVPIFENLITSGTETMVMAEMMKNPAMIAIAGPVYGADNYTTGAAYGNMMLVFSVMIAGAMNIFLVSKHTRQDEELGRLEVIRSLPVGRLSNLASSIIAAVIVNVILAIASGVGVYVLRENGMDFEGCMLFGAALGVIGLLFASCTAVFCQLTSNNRTVIGLSFSFMLVLYMMRAVGDVSSEVLSVISPLGLILRTQNFVNNYWWPIWLVLAISIVLIISALILASRRDLGRGLFAEKSGKRHAPIWLSGAYGLAIKLLRVSIVVWVITIFVFAAMYGSVFGELDRFISSNEMLQAIFSQSTEYSLVEQFIVLLMSIMTIIATIPALQFMGRVSTEEKRGHTEHLIGRSISRYNQMSAYLSIAFIVSIILQILAAFGFWSVGSMVLESTPSLKIFLVSALLYLPVIWVFIGTSMVLTAYLHKFTFLVYVYLGYAFVSVYLGALAGFPEWTKKLTPFGYIPQYPIEEIKIIPIIVIVGIAISLAIMGLLGYRKRDMVTH